MPPQTGPDSTPPPWGRVWLVKVSARKGKRAAETVFGLTEGQYREFERLVRQFLRAGAAPGGPAADAEVPTKVVRLVRAR
jgi:hypothetical protein